MAKNKIKAVETETTANKVEVEKSTMLRATKVEGSIIKLIDSTPQNTGDYSIAQVQIFTNETPLTPIQKYTPQLKTLSQLKNYFGVNGKTYKFVENMFNQSPTFANVTNYSFQIPKINFSEATPSKVESVECDVNSFNIMNNASLRLKWSTSSSKTTSLQATDITEAIKEAFNTTKEIGMLYVDDYYDQRNKERLCLATSNIVRYVGNYDKTTGKLKSIEPSKSNEDCLNKYVLHKRDGGFAITNDNSHYKEVNGLDFSACSSMEDVLEILNSSGFNAEFKYENEKLVVYTRSVGNLIKLEVVNCVSPDVDMDLKNVVFGDATPATTNTTAITDVTPLATIEDGVLKLVVNGVPIETTDIDFQSAGITTLQDVVDVLTKKAIPGVIFDVVSTNRIKITTTQTGSTASIDVVEKSEATIGTDLTTLITFGYPTPGSDGAVMTTGTNASGDDLIELYNEYANYIDFNGDVLSSTLELDIDYLYKINTKLVSSISSGNRVIFLHTIPDPYMTEASSHGALLDWLRTDLMGIYVSSMMGDGNLELRSAVLSMGCSQNVVVNNSPATQIKFDLHMKDVVIPSADTAKSINNEMLDLINGNGAGALSYFKQGFGWKLTIPKATKAWTWTDAVNMQNIIKTIAVKLSNCLATNSYTNKTDENIEKLKKVIYNLCLTLHDNGVLTKDISDFSQISYDYETAVQYITNTNYCTYVYAPKASTISGKIVPFTIYFGYATSVYGFEIQNVFSR